MPINLAEPQIKRQVSVPVGVWDSLDVTEFYETFQERLNSSNAEMYDDLIHQYHSDIDTGNHNYDHVWAEPNYTNPVYLDHYVGFIHIVAGFLGIERGYYMRVYDTDNTRIDWQDATGHYTGLLPVSYIDSEWDSDINASQFFIRCDHFEVTVFYSYNRSIYDNSTHALDFEALDLFVGIGFDDVGTIFNAWSLLNPILFFQAPNTLNLINLFIAIPIWVSVAYIVITVVLWFIPFLSKG